MVVIKLQLVKTAQPVSLSVTGQAQGPAECPIRNTIEACLRLNSTASRLLILNSFDFGGGMDQIEPQDCPQNDVKR